MSEPHPAPEPTLSPELGWVCPVGLPPTAPGLLDGLRVAVKDLFDIAGHVTAAGNATRAEGAPATATASVVDRLRAAGASIVGKSATDELAMGMFGVNTFAGTPLNPVAPDRVPGGSTSGSASLVAAGEVEVGIGTDTGGSIRVPGAFQGLVALRPSHGRIALDGVLPMAPGFDTCGILARTPDLVADTFAVLREAPRPPRTVRRLVLLTDLVERATPEVAERTRRTAANWAQALGVPLEDASLTGAAAPGLPANLLEVFWPLMSRQLWESNGAWVQSQRPRLGEGIEERIMTAGTVTDAMVASARTQQAALRERLAAVLDGAVAVVPTAQDAAPLRTSTHAELMAWRDANLALVVPGSLTGAPQVTLPNGTVRHPETGTVAPIGVSLLGVPGDDELLLDLALSLSPYVATDRVGEAHR